MYLIPPKLPKARRSLMTLSFALVTLISTQAQAIDLQDFRLQDVVPILSEMKSAANLSANQQALLVQIENKTKSITRVRDERRGQFQQSLKKRLKEKAPELRDLVTLMNQDDSISAQENQEMREAWMVLYDALSDTQREVVAALLYELCFESATALKIQDRAAKVIKVALLDNADNVEGRVALAIMEVVANFDTDCFSEK